MSNMTRGLVESYYDIQKQRIAVEGQLRAWEQDVSEQEEIWFKKTIVSRFNDMEKDTAKHIKNWVESEDIYQYWLKDTKGIGPIIAAGLISWIEDVEKFDTISKLWKYSGLHVDEETGRAAKRKKGQKINWNPRMKTLAWKIGESFVKQKNSGYRDLYDEFREEYDKKWKTAEDCGSPGCKSAGKGKCMKGHRYAAAKRKTVKVFLAHLHMKWREMKDLETQHPFIIGQDGHNRLIEPVED